MNRFTAFALTLTCLLASSGGRAQVRIADRDALEALRATPLETVYVHASSNLIFPGEYLYFSLYTINTQTYRLSAISDRAYVQLLDQEGRVYRQQKLRLLNGRGQGDMFIGTDLPSGAYKLVAFTHWMRNAGPDQFYAADISVINPYQSDQSALLDSPAPGVESAVPPASDSDTAIQDGLALETGGERFGTRQIIGLRLRNYRGNLGHGNYSLSVSRVPDLPQPPEASPISYSERYPGMLRQIPQQVGEVVAVPEQRGELLSGQVLPGTDSLSAEGLRVALSLPGDYFQLHAATTDAEGRFFTYLNNPYYGSEGFVQVLDPDGTPFEVELYDPARWEGSLQGFNPIRIDSTMRRAIQERSIHNQIENSYYEAKPDTIQTPYREDLFLGVPHEVYDLDDYTRFPTLQETLVEIVVNVYVRRDGSGSATFRVRPPGASENSPDSGDPPLVTVDGILVPEPGSLLDYNARNIRTIRVMQEERYLAGRRYQGLVALETLGGDYGETWDAPAGNRFAYQPPEIPKRYYRPRTENDNLPDFRHQLLWEPKLRLEGPLLELPFRTSDVPGTYRIRLEGYTTYGKPVALTSYIRVGD